MAISAADVKKLREKTGAGPMECKRALEECGGDFAAAEKLLKEKGLAAVEKRSDRATNEGKIFVRIQEQRAVLVELSCETDFVARNPEFIALGDTITDKILSQTYTEVNDDLNALVTDLATKIRENMSLKRFHVIQAEENEYLTRYIHGDGAIGVVVRIRADKPEALQREDLKAFAFNLALHVAAFSPLALDSTAIAPTHLREQEDIFRVQIQQDEKLKDKPENVRENALKGKINKYLKDVCLLDQGYVKDEKLTVQQALTECGKQVGAALTITDFVYYKVGEQI